MESIAITPQGNLLNYSHTEMIINVSVALIAGFFLSVVYRSTHKGLSYSQSFSQTIIFVTLIVAIVMMVIGGSLARAFALVGALSIIRFRTVLKDTKDMSYVFGALAVGMALGTSNYFLGSVGVISICGLAFVLNFMNFGAVYKSEFILRFRFQQSGDSKAYLETINELCKRSNLLHMEPSGDNQSLMLTYDIYLKDEATAKDLTKRMGGLPDVDEVVLIASKNDVDY
ncbi:DUF4956 domain-containing protein [candidate division KSB1 bacterium]|nr:DUF4956 domain-containing protein [candidate division KSB1 bacterium]NIS22868.1 DUF4956 domain-containing protein [candidate division KSB1 bacterium]NIT69706.1 DUF4956 domain-containing protein [candidate division KSB1 bacterium]NIU23374.1 DUF4956 domain-containing protein [candidate division KSB1 bacterium]NIU92292.1 DUF4956 domain-containing protein [candidate division KSB1 bacterium]